MSVVGVSVLLLFETKALRPEAAALLKVVCSAACFTAEAEMYRGCEFGYLLNAKGVNRVQLALS